IPSAAPARRSSDAAASVEFQARTSVRAHQGRLETGAIRVGIRSDRRPDGEQGPGPEWGSEAVKSNADSRPVGGTSGGLRSRRRPGGRTRALMKTLDLTASL